MTIANDFKLPDYTKGLPGNAMLCTADLTRVLGITRTGLFRRVSAGTFPPPCTDFRPGVDTRWKTFEGSFNRKCHWRLSALREFERGLSGQKKLLDSNGGSGSDRAPL